MKNEKGITLISLIVTVILIFILGSIGVAAGVDALETSKVQAFVSKMKLIQEAVDKVATQEGSNFVAYVNEKGDKSDNVNSYDSQAVTILEEVISKSSANACWYTVDEAIENYRYFDPEDINEHFELADFDVAIWLNPATRNIIAVGANADSYDGVKYKEEYYYRQYDLPNGQTLQEPVINKNFTLNYTYTTYDNKAEITLLNSDNEETVYAKVQYGKTDSEGKTTLSNVSKITITESGTYDIIAYNELGIQNSDTTTDTSGNVTSVPTTITTSEITIVNKPLLVDNMKPVKYNGTEWVECDSTDEEWYDYSNQKWANVKLIDGSMYVWIPRFAYEIEGESINVKFLKDFSNIGTDGKALESEYKVAPAFQNGTSTGFVNGEWDAEITGFWVAKYETTENSGKIQNINTSALMAWRGISAKDAFNKVLELKGIEDLKLNGTLDTHLMKNSEWGAVAYLSHSSFGAGASEIKWDGSYYISNNTGDAYSCTGNQYGIFALNGGANEFVAAGTDLMETLGYSENTSDKYATLYLADSNNNNIYGDAIDETSGWNGNNSEYTSESVFLRGGDINNQSKAGIFAYESSSGNAEDSVSFRPVIIVEY